jgi:hypothetical protein
MKLADGIMKSSHIKADLYILCVISLAEVIKTFNNIGIMHKERLPAESPLVYQSKIL